MDKQIVLYSYNGILLSNGRNELLIYITTGEGNGNPLQYSCLGNPMDRGAWWAPVHWVAKCWTRLK